MINISYLNDVSGGDITFIHDILRMYLNQTVPEIEKLIDILDSGKMADLASSSHRVKSSIQMLGNETATQLIFQIEKMAKSQESLTEIKEQIQQLVKVNRQMVEEINNILKK